MENLKSLLSETVVSQVLQVSSLVTLSSRIHQHAPYSSVCGLGQHHAPEPTTPQYRQLQKDLTALKAMLQQKWNNGASSESGEGGGASWHGEGGGASGSGEGGGASGGVRWRVVEDMSAWLQCPLGLCPGQSISSDMLELDQPSSSGREEDKEGAGVGCSSMEDSIVLGKSDEPTHPVLWHNFQGVKYMMCSIAPLSRLPTGTV